MFGSGPRGPPPRPPLGMMGGMGRGYGPHPSPPHPHHLGGLAIGVQAPGSVAIAPGTHLAGSVQLNANEVKRRQSTGSLPLGNPALQNARHRISRQDSVSERPGVAEGLRARSLGYTDEGPIFFHPADHEGLAKQHTFSDLIKRIELLDKNERALRAAIWDKDNIIDDLRSAVKEKAREAEQEGDESTTLRKENERLSQEVTKLKEDSRELARAKKFNHELRVETGRLLSEVEALKAGNIGGAAQDHVVQLQRQIASLEAENEALQSLLKSQVGDTPTGQDEHRVVPSELIEFVQQVKLDNASLERDNQRLQAQIEDLKRERKLNGEEVDGFRARIADLEDDTSRARRSADAAARRESSHVQSLQTENKDLRSALRKAQTALQEFRSEAERLGSRQQMQAMLEDNQLIAANEEIHRLREENASHLTLVQKKEVFITELTSELQKKQRELVQLRRASRGGAGGTPKSTTGNGATASPIASSLRNSNTPSSQNGVTFSSHTDSFRHSQPPSATRSRLSQGGEDSSPLKHLRQSLQETQEQLRRLSMEQNEFKASIGRGGSSRR